MIDVYSLDRNFDRPGLLNEALRPLKNGLHRENHESRTLLSLNRLKTTMKNQAFIYKEMVKRAVFKPADISKSYYEYKALRLQMPEITAGEALDYIKAFRRGENPDNKFLFHYTNEKGIGGIVKDKTVNASKLGVFGPGVYTGVTSLPSKVLMRTPYIGWGLWTDAKYRVPIYINEEIREKAVKSGPRKCVRIKVDNVKLSPLCKKKFTR